jgi:hypothetical protein
VDTKKFRVSVNPFHKKKFNAEIVVDVFYDFRAGELSQRDNCNLALCVSAPLRFTEILFSFTAEAQRGLPTSSLSPGPARCRGRAAVAARQLPPFKKQCRDEPLNHFF